MPLGGWVRLVVVFVFLEKRPFRRRPRKQHPRECCVLGFARMWQVLERRPRTPGIESSKTCNNTESTSRALLRVLRALGSHEFPLPGALQEVCDDACILLLTHVYPLLRLRLGCRICDEWIHTWCDEWIHTCCDEWIHTSSHRGSFL